MQRWVLVPKTGCCPKGGLPTTTALLFVLESLKTPLWGCQWGLMEALSITPRLSTEKYDCRVNQPMMNCVHWGFSLNLKWWRSHKFVTLQDFIGQVGIFCFMHKKTSTSLGADKLEPFELSM